MYVNICISFCKWFVFIICQRICLPAIQLYLCLSIYKHFFPPIQIEEFNSSHSVVCTAALHLQLEVENSSQNYSTSCLPTESYPCSYNDFISTKNIPSTSLLSHFLVYFIVLPFPHDHSGVTGVLPGHCDSCNLSAGLFVILAIQKLKYILLLHSLQVAVDRSIGELSKSPI